MCYQNVNQMLRVAVIEDNEFWRYLIQNRLERSGSFKVVANCSIGKEFFANFKSMGEIDLVILDLDLPGDNGFEVADKMKSCFPHIPVVVFSSIVKHSIQAAFYSLGVMAVLSKNLINSLDEELLIALGKGNEDFYDHSQLSREEMKLLLGICEGRTNKELANTFFKEEATVEYRCRALAGKVKIKNKRNSFIAFAIKYGFWYPEKNNF